MNILFLANRFPYPPFRGDKLKIFNLCRRLSKTHDLYLLTFYEKRSELEDLQHILPFFKEVELVYLPQWKSVLNCIPALFSRTPLQIAYFRSRKMHRKLNELLARYAIDVVHTQHLRMAQYTRKITKPKVLDLPDAFSLYWKRRRDTDRPWYFRILDQLEIRRLVRYEAVIGEYDLCLVCSDEDKRYLQKVHKKGRVEISLNGVDLDTFDVGSGHDYTIDHTVLFTGNMDYAPNVDAVTHFVKSIWPQVRKQCPKARFVIAGQRPVLAVKQLASDSIQVTGFIPELQEIYKEASVVVAPLRFGAGTQNKVLEAMAMGVPVVCTHIGFEGLGIQSGEGVFLCKDTDLFADQLVQLIESESLRRATGEAGLKVAREKFSWDVVSDGLQAYFASAIA